MITYLGLDPGETTGLVVATFDGPRLVALVSRTLHRPEPGARRSHADADIELSLRVGATVHALLGETPLDWIVAEEPFDVNDGWRHGSGRPRKRGTGFRIGAHYAAALCGAASARPGASKVSYPVRGNTKRRGWMGRAKSTAAHAKVRHVLRVAGLTVGTDHEVAALGVILHHRALVGWQERTEGLRRPA